MAKNENWFLLAYDIGNDRRLAKVYRYLLSVGTPVQQSVFLVFTSVNELNGITDRVRELMMEDEDDFAVFRTDAPYKLWRYGKGDHLPIWQRQIKLPHNSTINSGKKKFIPRLLATIRTRSNT